jgi:drug/metabolite transporter (DMT)-like permease
MIARLTRLSVSRGTKMLVCFATVYLFWGSSYAATRIGVLRLPPFLFAGIRFVIGGLLLLGVARLLGARLKLNRRELKHVLVMALCAVVISNGCNVWGVQRVNSNQAALLNASCAFWIAIFGMYGARAQPLSARLVFGLVTGFIGTALVISPAIESLDPTLWPQIVILVGCIGWSAGTIYLRNARSTLDLLSFTGLQMIIGGLMLLVPALLLGQANAWRWSAAGVGALAYMVIFSACLGYTAYAWLANHVSPAQVGTYAFVNPAVAAVVGWAVLDERFGAAQWLGMIVILAGVALVTWPTGKQAMRAPVEPSG